jgi:DNA-binding MarR family transcriptional regulator
VLEENVAMSEYHLNESVAFLLNRAGVRMGMVFSSELDKYSLSIPMWRVLAALWSYQEVRLTEIEALTSMDLSTLSRHVAALVKRKLVLRTRSADDARASNLRLSTQGRALVEKIIPAVHHDEGQALMGITEADIRRLKTLLTRIYSNLR